MEPRPLSRPFRFLHLLAPIVTVDLTIQYSTGVATSVRAPASGFTASTSFPFYDVHVVNGYVAGGLALVMLVVALLTRRMYLYAPAAIVLAAVAVAGIAGMIFVDSSPNSEIASIVMGSAFLFSFTVALGMSVWMWAIRLHGRFPGMPPVPDA